MEETIKCLIIGSGPAGYTAAIYTSRANLQPVLYEGIEPGGQLTTTTDVENFPGYPDGVSGQQMMADMRRQAERFGTEIRTGTATRVDLASRPFHVVIDGEKEIRAESLIIATGASARYLGLPSETKFRGMGVSACATCDGFFYRKKDVAVVGGGYIGLEMAEALLHLGKEVTLIEAEPRLLASFEPEFSELAAQELEKNGVRVRVGCRVQEIADAGSERIVRTSQGDFPCDMILMSVGVVPATDFLRDTGIRMARNGAILVDREMRTSLEHIYAAGDCAVVYHRLMEEDYFIPLGTYANKCGRIAGGNMAGAHEKFVGALGTAAIKVCGLEMGRTGMSEKDAARLGIDYCSKLVTANDHPAYYPAPTKLVIKLIYETRTRRLLGACVAGEKGAVMRADIFAVAIHAGMTTDELGMVDLAYAPPFSGVWDAVHIAANAAK